MVKSSTKKSAKSAKSSGSKSGSKVATKSKSRSRSSSGRNQDKAKRTSSKTSAPRSKSGSRPRSASRSEKPQKKVSVEKVRKERKEHKPHRFRPGTVALREIRKYQRMSGLLMPRLPFSKLVREYAHELSDGNKSGEKVQFQASALTGLQEATENYLVDVLEQANMNALHADRKTVQSKDLELVQRQRGEPVVVAA